MQSVVKGDLVPISDLQNITDWGNVKKVRNTRGAFVHALLLSVLQYNKLNNEPALKGAGPKEKYVVNEIVISSVAMKSVGA